MPPDSPSYVQRHADDELFHRVLDGEYCYVLTPRQMGKSSLMARTAKGLQLHGIRTAVVDLTGIGGVKQHVTAAQWYYGFMYQLLRDLRINFDLEAWWKEKENLPPLQRLTDFFGEVLLNLIAEPVVIFVDEIDTTIGLPFADDFFAAIRAGYNARALDATYRRLTFVLLGVASPAELIQDARRTPFNIGWPIELTDFTPDEARVLVTGLSYESRDREAILERVLYWTAGHPYLTQKLCRAVAEEPCDGVNYADLVDRVVNRYFLGPQAVRTEENLKFVAGRLKHDASSSKPLLRLLTRVRHGTAVTYDPTSGLHVALKLSGVVAPGTGGRLALRNRIYNRVFTANWAKTDRLLGAVWVRRSMRYAAAGQRDHALLCRLRALEFEPADAHRREAAHLAGDDFAMLRATLRHAGPLTTVAWSPDGATLLTASEDHTAQLWDAASGEPKGPRLRHRGPIWAAAFSPRGTVVATVSRDFTGRLWRADTGLPAGPPLRHRKPVWVALFSPRGDSLLTSSDDGTARLWDPETGEPLNIILRHDAPVEAAAFTPDGALIATASSGNELRLWDARTGSQLGQPVNLGSRASVVVFSPDGCLLFTAGDDRTGRLWRIDPSATPYIRRVFLGQPDGDPFLLAVQHLGWIRSACFTPDGAGILTGSEDNTACLWESCSAAALGRPLRHEGWVRTVALGPGGAVAATGSEDKTSCLWSIPSGEPLCPKLRHQARVVAVRFSPDGSALATASHDGTARVWSVGAKRDSSVPAVRHDAVVTAVAFSRDGRLMATASEDRTARLWNADGATPVCDPLKHDGAVRVVTFAPDRNVLLTGSDDTNALLWNGETGRPEAFLFHHDGEIRAAAFSEDGSVVATGSADTTVRMWNARTGEPLPAVLRHESAVDAVQFSPDGSRLLTVSSRNTARIWTVATGELASTLPHEGPLHAIAFSATGRTVATGSDDDTAMLWSADTGQPLSVPLRHSGGVHALAFSPDGQILASGDDGNLCLWRADFGAPLAKPLPHAEPVRSVAFSPGGKLILCATESWLHAYTAGGRAVASRPLPGVWAGAWRFLREAGTRIRAAVRWTPDTVVVVEIDFEEGATPLEGDPHELLESCGRRCGLKIDERDRVVARWPPDGKAPRRGR